MHPKGSHCLQLVLAAACLNKRIQKDVSCLILLLNSPHISFLMLADDDPIAVITMSAQVCINTLLKGKSLPQLINLLRSQTFSTKNQKDLTSPVYLGLGNELKHGDLGTVQYSGTFLCSWQRNYSEVYSKLYTC